MTQNTAVQQFLEDLSKELETEASEKVTKAMRLFMQIDNTMKGVVMHNSPFGRGKKPLTAKNLREWFDTLDLLDDLDNVIFDMEDDLRANASVTGGSADKNGDSNEG